MPNYKAISGMVMVLSLAACSAGGEQGDQQGQKTDKLAENNSATAGLPAPSHVLTGRTLTINMPYRRADKLTWVAGNHLGETGPFRFKTSAVETGTGGSGIDVYRVVYEASGPGEAALRFALVPAGKTLIGPKKSVFEGKPASEYIANVSVTE
jgi:hypothetical protein